MYKSKLEIQNIQNMVEYLCLNYPELFQLEEYNHPVHGKCISMIIKEVKIDIRNITSILFDFYNNTLTIDSSPPVKCFVLTNIIKDNTVF